MDKLSGNHAARKLCRMASLLVLALGLSFLETLFPLPLPGLKLGLANVVITATFFFCGKGEAATVSLVRMILCALLFGSFISFLFSAVGALFSYLSLWLTGKGRGRFFSMLGISLVSAAAHHVGQLLVAAVLFAPGVIFTYLPLLLFLGIFTGAFSGFLLLFAEKNLQKISENALKS